MVAHLGNESTLRPSRFGRGSNFSVRMLALRFTTEFPTTVAPARSRNTECVNFRSPSWGWGQRRRSGRLSYRASKARGSTGWLHKGSHGRTQTNTDFYSPMSVLFCVLLWLYLLCSSVARISDRAPIVYFIATPCGRAGPVVKAVLKSTSNRRSSSSRFLKTLTTRT